MIVLRLVLLCDVMKNEIGCFYDVAFDGEGKMVLDELLLKMVKRVVY